jgi:hypothetical protein
LEVIFQILDVLPQPDDAVGSTLVQSRLIEQSQFPIGDR